jgi:hypothetical protein
MRFIIQPGLTMPNVQKRSTHNEFAAQRIKPVAISIDLPDVSEKL